MRSRLAMLVCTCVCAWAAPAAAVTEPDLSGRMTIDGYTNDYSPDEAVFGLTAAGLPEEAPDDSRWSPQNDVRQIRISWDVRRLYVAVEGTIWGNNMILAIDSMTERGVSTMSLLNSWRRAFDFVPGFDPDLFACTWDENTAPRLLRHQSGNVVSDDLPGALFQASATFFRDLPNTSMEFAIPWSVVFPGLTRDTVMDVGAGPQDVTTIPACVDLRLAAFVTGGPDGVSGPDSAPNNLTGHPVDYLIPVTIDNWAIVTVDADCDGVADIGIEPRSRTAFHDVSTPVARPTWGGLKARYR